LRRHCSRTRCGIGCANACAARCRAHAGELSNVLREAGHPVPQELLRFGTHVKKKESKLYGNHFKDIDTSVKAKKTTFDDSD
jgi:ATP-dependent RNA helicase DBP3